MRLDKYNTNSQEIGQSLIEILIGAAIGAVLIGAAAGALMVTLRSAFQNKALRTGSSLTQELLDKVAVYAESRWRNIHDLTKSPDKWLLTVAGNGFATSTGSEYLTIDNVAYERYFAVNNVQRDSNENIVSSGGTNDPSTQLISFNVSWFQSGATSTISRSIYLTRKARNLILRQTDWSGGGGQIGPITEVNTRYDSSTLINIGAALTMSSPPNVGNLTSSIFDSNVSGGIALNVVMWQGALNGGTVKFQIASSDLPGGPWDYVGPDGTSSTYYQPSGPNVQLKISGIYNNNDRYFRYKIFLDGAVSPQVEDVIISYNP